MMRKIHMVLLLGAVGMMVFAMNPTKLPETSRVEEPQTPLPSRVEQADSPSDVPSPVQARMRARGVRRNLSASMSQINPAIYRVLPRPTVTPPNLNVPVDLIVNDWFFAHITDEQEALLNRIAVGIPRRERTIPQGERIMLSSEEYQLFKLFPTWITQQLYPFITFSDEDVETTELVPSSEGTERSEQQRSKKRK